MAGEGTNECRINMEGLPSRTPTPSDNPSDQRDRVYCFCDPCECRPCKGTREPPPSFPEIPEKDPYNREIICGCTDCSCEKCRGTIIPKVEYPEPTYICECSPCNCTPTCSQRQGPTPGSANCGCLERSKNVCNCRNCRCEKCIKRKQEQAQYGIKYAYAYQSKPEGKPASACFCPEKNISRIPRPIRSRSLSLHNKTNNQKTPRSRSANSSEKDRKNDDRPATEKLRSRLPIKCPPNCKGKSSTRSRSPFEPIKLDELSPRKKPTKCTNNCRTCMCHFCLKEKKRRQEEKDKNRLNESEKWNINVMRGRWEDQCIIFTPEVMSRSHPSTCQCEKCFGNSENHPNDCHCCHCGEKETFYDARENLDDEKDIHDEKRSRKQVTINNKDSALTSSCSCDKCDCPGEEYMHKNVPEDSESIPPTKGPQGDLSCNPGCVCIDCKCVRCKYDEKRPKSHGSARSKDSTYFSLKSNEQHPIDCKCPICVCDPCLKGGPGKDCFCDVCHCTKKVKSLLSCQCGPCNEPEVHPIGCQCITCQCDPCEDNGDDKLRDFESPISQCTCVVCECKPCESIMDNRYLNDSYRDDLTQIVIIPDNRSGKHAPGCTCIKCVCNPCIGPNRSMAPPVNRNMNVHPNCHCPICECNPCNGPGEEVMGDTQMTRQQQQIYQATISGQASICQCDKCLCEPCSHTINYQGDGTPIRKKKSTPFICNCPICQCQPCKGQHKGKSLPNPEGSAYNDTSIGSEYVKHVNIEDYETDNPKVGTFSNTKGKQGYHGGDEISESSSKRTPKQNYDDGYRRTENRGGDRQKYEMSDQGYNESQSRGFREQSDGYNDANILPNEGEAQNRDMDPQEYPCKCTICQCIPLSSHKLIHGDDCKCKMCEIEKEFKNHDIDDDLCCTCPTCNCEPCLALMSGGLRKTGSTCKCKDLAKKPTGCTCEICTCQGVNQIGDFTHFPEKDISRLCDCIKCTTENCDGLSHRTGMTDQDEFKTARSNIDGSKELGSNLDYDLGYGYSNMQMGDLNENCGCPLCWCQPCFTPGAKPQRMFSNPSVGSENENLEKVLDENLEEDVELTESQQFLLTTDQIAATKCGCPICRCRPCLCMQESLQEDDQFQPEETFTEGAERFIDHTTSMGIGSQRKFLESLRSKNCDCTKCACKTDTRDSFYSAKSKFDDMECPCTICECVDLTKLKSDDLYPDINSYKMPEDQQIFEGQGPEVELRYSTVNHEPLPNLKNDDEKTEDPDVEQQEVELKYSTLTHKSVPSERDKNKLASQIIHKEVELTYSGAAHRPIQEMDMKYSKKSVTGNETSNIKDIHLKYSAPTIDTSERAGLEFEYANRTDDKAGTHQKVIEYKVGKTSKSIPEIKRSEFVTKHGSSFEDQHIDSCKAKACDCEPCPCDYCIDPYMRSRGKPLPISESIMNSKIPKKPSSRSNKTKSRSPPKLSRIRNSNESMVRKLSGVSSPLPNGETSSKEVLKKLSPNSPCDCPRCFCNPCRDKSIVYKSPTPSEIRAWLTEFQVNRVPCDCSVYYFATVPDNEHDMKSCCSRSSRANVSQSGARTASAPGVANSHPCEPYSCSPCKLLLNAQPLPCDCEKCDCDPCSDPKLRNSESIRTIRNTASRSVLPCDCQFCKCEPCSDPKAKYGSVAKPVVEQKVCGCNPCPDSGAPMGDSASQKRSAGTISFAPELSVRGVSAHSVPPHGDGCHCSLCKCCDSCKQLSRPRTTPSHQSACSTHSCTSRKSHKLPEPAVPSMTGVEKPPCVCTHCPNTPRSPEMRDRKLSKTSCYSAAATSRKSQHSACLPYDTGKISACSMKKCSEHDTMRIEDEKAFSASKQSAISTSTSKKSCCSIKQVPSARRPCSCPPHDCACGPCDEMKLASVNIPPCDCPICQCETCADPNIKPGNRGAPKEIPPCDCVFCQCNPCADPNSKTPVIEPCDCEICRCGPCADPKKTRTEVTDLPISPCDCAVCQCEPCADTKMRYKPAGTPVTNLDDAPTPSIKTHPLTCDCDVCTCSPCLDVGDFGAKSRGPEPGQGFGSNSHLACDCPVCMCPKCGDETKGPQVSQKIPGGSLVDCHCSAVVEPHGVSCDCEVCACSPCGDAEIVKSKGPVGVLPCDCPICKCAPCADATKGASKQSIPVPNIPPCDCGEVCPCEACPTHLLGKDAQYVISPPSDAEALLCDCEICKCDDCADKTVRKAPSKATTIKSQMSTKSCGTTVKSQMSTKSCPGSVLSGRHSADKRSVGARSAKSIGAQSFGMDQSVLPCDCKPCECEYCADPNAAAQKGMTLIPACDCYVCKCVPCADPNIKTKTDSGDGAMPHEETKMPCDCAVCKCSPCADSTIHIGDSTQQMPCDCTICKCAPCADVNITSKVSSEKQVPCDCEVCRCVPCADPSIEARRADMTVPCDCTICKCQPCADPNKKADECIEHTVPCDCDVCKCEPCADPHIDAKCAEQKFPCDCDICKCVPCADSRLALVSGDKKISTICLDDKIPCDCDICKCSPCADSKINLATAHDHVSARSGKSAKSADKSGLVYSGIPCDCEVCDCNPCAQSMPLPTAEGDMANVPCDCTVCKCVPCADPNVSRQRPVEEISSHMPCDCEICKCSPCADPTKGLSSNVSVSTKGSSYYSAPDKLSHRSVDLVGSAMCGTCKCTKPCNCTAAKAKSSGIGVGFPSKGKVCSVCRCTPCECLTEGLPTRGSRGTMQSSRSLARSQRGAAASGSISESKLPQSKIGPSFLKSCMCSEQRKRPGSPADKLGPPPFQKPGSSAPSLGITRSRRFTDDEWWKDMDTTELHKKLLQLQIEAREMDEDIIRIQRYMLQLQCCCGDEHLTADPSDVDPREFADAVRGLRIASTRLHNVCIQRHRVINAVVDELDKRRTRDQLPSHYSDRQVMRTPAEKPCAVQPQPSLQLDAGCTCSEPMLPLTITEIRRVVPDGLLVKWDQPGSGMVKGYEIDVNNMLKHRVHSAARTAAVLHQMDLTMPHSLAVYAISLNGERCNPPATGQYQPPVNCNCSPR